MRQACDVPYLVQADAAIRSLRRGPASCRLNLPVRDGQTALPAGALWGGRTAGAQPHNREPRNIDFGTPGMGQLNIPGVSKGFVPSQATKLSGSALMKMYQPGDRVMHRKFGEGKVVSVEKAGADARITIDFIAYGSKEFSLAIAPIFKLED